MQAGVPDDAAFATKPAIAPGLLEQALAQGLRRGFVLADAGYGSDTAFREAVSALGLPYAMGVGPAASVWAPGVRPLAQTKPWSGKGQRPLLRLRRDGERKPVSVKELGSTCPGKLGGSSNGGKARTRVSTGVSRAWASCGSSRQSALRTAPRGVASCGASRGCPG